MRLFECQACGQALYFENVLCESCGRKLGYLPRLATLSALEPEDDKWRALADPGRLYRHCANVAHETCNWLVADDSADQFCIACRHNSTIPNLSEPRNLLLWRKIEVAKHRLFYSLLRFHLPLINKAGDPGGLAFDFLDAAGEPVMTGHLDGTITINLAEADDAHREKQRDEMGEPYRTLLGHFRHEVAHYYWDRLVRDHVAIDRFREIFGDERDDYGEALKRHYAQGAPADWSERFVSPYAAAHAWEDFAETWAHYFHIVDTLETAAAFGVRIRPRIAAGAELAAAVDFDPYRAGMERLVEAWLPLTFAFNSINRSMGLSDLYPFVLTPAVILKLSFIHEQVHRRSLEDEPDDEAALKAMAAGLRKAVAAPASQ
jgi:hypothetical protein